MLRLTRPSLPLVFAGVVVGVASISGAQERTGVSQGLSQNPSPPAPDHSVVPAASGARGERFGTGSKSRYKIAYATYFGGSGTEDAREVIVYPDGSVLVGGQTNSPDLPVTEGVVQPRYAGDDPALGHSGIYGGDCYLLRLSPDGQKILAAT